MTSAGFIRLTWTACDGSDRLDLRWSDTQHKMGQMSEYLSLKSNKTKIAFIHNPSGKLRFHITRADPVLKNLVSAEMNIESGMNTKLSL